MDVLGLIDAAARQYNLDPQAMKAIAKIESGFNPLAKNENSSASGVYQFINSTAKQYGLSNPFDAAANIDAGARFMVDNANGLRGVLGRDPDVGELYLAHQQGLGGARKLLGNPNARAVDIVGADAVRLNGGHAGMSALEFANMWMNKARGAAGQPMKAGTMSAQQHLDDFDKSLEANVSTRGATDMMSLLPMFQGMPGGEDPLKLSPRHHIAAAMMDIGDRMVAIGQGNPVPQRRAGQEMLERQRMAQGRNATAQMLKQQGYGELANMVLGGQMTGQQAMSLIYRERHAQIQNAGGPNYSKQVQYATDPETGELRAYVTADDGTWKWIDLDGMQPAPSGVRTIETETGTVIVDRAGNRIGEVGDNFRAARAREADVKYRELVPTVNSARSQVAVLYNHPGLEGAVGPIAGNVDLDSPAAQQFVLSDEAREFISLHDRLMGGVFLEAFEQLKGGGQITEIEGLKAERARASMNRATSAEAYRAALETYIDSLMTGLAKLDDARNDRPTRLDDTQMPWDLQQGPGQSGFTNTQDPFGVR